MNNHQASAANSIVYLTLINMASQILRMTWGEWIPPPPLISLNLGITAPPKFHKIIFCM